MAMLMLIAVSGGLTITAAAQGAPAPAVTETPAEAAIVKNFEDRIAAFEKLAHTAQKAAPTPKSTPSTTQLEASRKVVAARLRRVRASAKIGDIFTPDVAALLRRRLALTWNGPKGAAIRASLRHGEPLATKALPVNSSYPKAVPLQSTPPDLLAVLPPLPNDLEYRFVGRDLILHSLPSNLVVDVLPDALPPAP